MCTPGGCSRKEEGFCTPLPPLGLGEMLYIYRSVKITSVYIYSTYVHKLVVTHLLSYLLYDLQSKGRASGQVGENILLHQERLSLHPVSTKGKPSILIDWECIYMRHSLSYYLSLLLAFIFIQNAEALLQLKEADAFTSDCDDRRYVIQISHPALKKSVTCIYLTAHTAFACTHIDIIGYVIYYIYGTHIIAPYIYTKSIPNYW